MLWRKQSWVRGTGNLGRGGLQFLIGGQIRVSLLKKWTLSKDFRGSRELVMGILEGRTFQEVEQPMQRP